MSWSVSYIGKPDAIKRKLAEESARLKDHSKLEFDAVKPALETILDQQVGNGLIHLNANGHANFERRTIKADSEGTPTETELVKTYGNCNVDVKSLGAQLVE